MLRRYDIHFEALRKTAFPCINFKAAINNKTEIIFLHKILFKLYPKNKYIDTKEFITSRRHHFYQLLSIKQLHPTS